ncbi:MAG: alpha-L-fucosidase [Sphingobacterium sp.]|jgi:alpha-L-fucosidase|nr:alpha-L-fucosidase [Sphingobacterium sp.]
MKQVKWLFFFLCIFLCGSAHAQIGPLNESNADFDRRLKWFKDAKYGMFVHFGLYSQLAGKYNGKEVDGYAEWIQATADIPKEEYAKIIADWNPKDFNAETIVLLAKEAGMKYLVITTKHHDGFCLWDSKYTEFDIANSPMKGRDFIKELAEACHKYGLKFCTYYSIIDWHHDSQYRNTGDNSWARWGQVAMKPDHKQEYITYMKNQLRELIETYNTEMIWFDGDWVAWWDMEQGMDLYAYLRKLKPSLIINNRVAKRDHFKYDFGTPEQEHPDSAQRYLWEACYTMNDSWGFKQQDHNWKTPEDIFVKLGEINGKGGNLLLNIGPDGDGRIPPASVTILKEVGNKLDGNRQAKAGVAKQKKSNKKIK